MFVTEYLNTDTLSKLNELINTTLNTVVDIETDGEEYFKKKCEDELKNINRHLNDDGSMTTFYLLSTNFEIAFANIFEEEGILTSFTKDNLFDQIKIENLEMPTLKIICGEKIRNFV